MEESHAWVSAFRKRFRLAPSLWLNLSKAGGSLSVGGHGLTVNLNEQGHKETISAPGTGIS